MVENLKVSKVTAVSLPELLWYLPQDLILGQAGRESKREMKTLMRNESLENIDAVCKQLFCYQVQLKTFPAIQHLADTELV